MKPAKGRPFPGRWLLAVLLGLAPLLLGSAGCRTAAHGEPGTFASVVIDGSSMEEIRRATIDVFTSHDYATVLGGPDILVFEMSGSSMDNILYGGWSSGKISIRAKVYISPAGVTSHVLSCQAFRVHDANDPALEEERKLSKLRGGSYKKLLEEVQEKVNQPELAP